MRVSVVGSLLFSRFTAYFSPFSLVSFCNTEVSEFLDMENSEQLFVARVPKNVTELLPSGKTPKRNFFRLKPFINRTSCSLFQKGCSVKSKHANGLKHQTQALMGATRLASGKDSAII